MVSFPVLLVTAVSILVHRVGQPDVNNHLGFSILLFVLLPEVLTVLGMLLWATPIVNSELEGQTWIYSVIRPGARRSMLLGKYIVAVVWTCSCTCAAASIAVPITGMPDAMKAWSTICMLCIVSAAAHGALFVFIGTFFQRRAMVSAFVYAIVIEGVLAWIPATINQFTIGFRLRSMLVHEMQLDFGDIPNFRRLVSDGTTSLAHIGVLGVGAAILLSLTVWRIQSSQYSMQSEL
jgi:small basic protein